MLELYGRGTISSSEGARLLRMSRIGFVRYPSVLGITHFDLSKEEWEIEPANSSLG